MNSSANVYPICGKSLGEKDDLIMTRCGHIYHRICAQDRHDNRQKTDCRVCGKESAFGEALDRDMGMTEAQCSICGKSLNMKDDLTTTACGHTCHRTYAEYRPNTMHTIDCRVCYKDSVPEEMLDQDTKSERSTTA
jgi:transcription elongation factor Elf1